MRLTVTIETSNAAFDGEQLGPELRRVLRFAADEIEASANEAAAGHSLLGALNGRKLLDTNGNTCGEIRLRR